MCSGLIAMLLFAGGDKSPVCLVVCPDAFRQALAPWSARRTEQGYRIITVPSAGSAEKLQRAIGSAAAQHHARFLLLVGDASGLAERTARPHTIPTHFIPAKVNVRFGSESEIATDAPYADLDDDDLPDLALGRLPVRSADELNVIVEKILRYEKTMAVGDWRRRIHFVACLANFGPLIDSAIEQSARSILTEGIPPSFVTTMTYGNWTSPYCPPPDAFQETAIGRLNEGGLFWIYIGHGHRRRVDDLRLPGQPARPILEASDVDRVAGAASLPIAIFLSCYSGAFDGSVDSLGELLLKRPGGPVAVLAGTRVTMPYALTVLGTEMMRLYFAGEISTLGELMRAAKRESVARPRGDLTSRRLDTLARWMNPDSPDLEAERREHVALFHLLGDPTLALPRSERVLLEAAASAQAGAAIQIRGRSPFAGTGACELVLRRDRMRGEPPARRAYTGQPEQIEEYARSYARANDPVLVAKPLSLANREFEITMKLPPDAKGPCHIRAYIAAPGRLAIGHCPIEIAPPAKQDLPQSPTAQVDRAPAP